MKYKIISILILVVTAFAYGRYSVNTNTETKTNTETTKNTNTHKETTISKDKNGNEITKIVEDTVSKKIKDSEVNVEQQIQKRNALNISALVGTGLFNGLAPVYGASISKEFIGPVTLGLFGLTNGIVGVSLGLNF